MMVDVCLIVLLDILLIMSISAWNVGLTVPVAVGIRITVPAAMTLNCCKFMALKDTALLLVKPATTSIPAVVNAFLVNPLA